MCEKLSLIDQLNEWEKLRREWGQSLNLVIFIDIDKYFNSLRFTYGTTGEI
jgi:hypothetical protein